MTTLDQESFAELVLSRVGEGEPKFPQVVYDSDGDCIEFLASGEDFYAKRVDELVTAYVGRDSGKVIGSLIKGVNTTIRKYLRLYPGFGIELRHGRMRLEHFFTAVIWESKEDNCSIDVILRLRKVAEEADAEVELELQEA